MRIDLHQHLWPERLLDALARRSTPPLLRRTADGWVLRLEGEPDQPVDLDDHDPDARAALVEADGLDRALVAPSSPLGIEALPAAEAAVGEQDEAEADVMTLSGRLNDLTHSGDGELADALRPLYVDYLAQDAANR